MTTASKGGGDKMETATKAKRSVVEAVQKFADIKAQIKELEEVEAELRKLINEAFGDSDLLTHHNVEVARRDWRERSTLSDKVLRELIAKRLGHDPELAEIVSKLVDDSYKTTRYSVIVNLYK